jgi:predicted nucleic acid-binding protein
MKAVFDTNILVDYLNGIDAAQSELNRYKTRLVSVITQLEILVGVADEMEERAVRSFLSTFRIIALTPAIAEEAVKVRTATRMKIPDAIVYATARDEGCLVVTRNKKDFKPAWPDVRIPYEI